MKRMKMIERGGRERGREGETKNRAERVKRQKEK